MKTLDETYKKQVLDYLYLEPEFNVFAIGDIESLGMETDYMHVLTSDKWSNGPFPFIILQFYDNYIVYSKNTKFCSDEITNYLKKTGFADISGKKMIVEEIVKHFSDKKIVLSNQAKLEKIIWKPEIKDVNIKRLDSDNAKDIYNIKINIDEFSSIKNLSKEDAIERITTSLLSGNRMYGLFVQDKLVCIGGTTAESSRLAMIMGIATLPSHRNKGYASLLVSKLCNDCLNDQKKFLCLFYDNPKAGEIYKKIGFIDVGIYAIGR